MKEQLTPQLKKIIRAVQILSPSAFIFAGRTVNVPEAPAPPPPQQQAQGFAAPQQHALTALLEQNFYQYCYSRTFDGELRDDFQPPVPEGNLLPALSAANTSRERWDAGWQIFQLLPSGQIMASKNGMTRALWPGEFLSTDAPGMAPRPGQHVSVFFMKESAAMQPGFYFAFGEAQTDEQDHASLVRFYWNAAPEGAAALMAGVTRRLNRFQIPFRFKCLNNSAYFTRHDCAVLFVNRRFYRLTAELLADAHAEVAAYMRPATPLFTKRLADGLGLAEEPYTGESFGMQRCRILAEGIWSAYTQGLQETEARMNEVVNHFARYGIMLERPYLNAGSIDLYEFPLDRRR